MLLSKLEVEKMAPDRRAHSLKYRLKLLIESKKIENLDSLFNIPSINKEIYRVKSQIRRIEESYERI